MRKFLIKLYFPILIGLLVASCHAKPDTNLTEIVTSQDVNLDFLKPDQKYVAEVYAEGESADRETNPLDIEIENFVVDSETALILKLAPGAGTAIRFRPATESEIEKLPEYQP